MKNKNQILKCINEIIEWLYIAKGSDTNLYYIGCKICDWAKKLYNKYNIKNETIESLLWLEVGDDNPFSDCGIYINSTIEELENLKKELDLGE